jgi:uncharacterized membrane protein
MTAKRILTGSVQALILVSVCVFICYSHRYNSPYGAWSLVGICGGFLILTAIRLNGQKSDDLRNSIIFTFTGLIVGCVLAGYVLRWVYQKYELAAHGLITKGIVVGFNQVTVKHTVANYAVVYYRFNNRFYTQEFRDADNMLLTSDTVTMLCSSTDPELCDITAYQRNGVQIKW